MKESRNTDGRFTPEHTDAEVLAAVRAHEPAATSEVADEVGMTRQGADRRLRSLRDEGRVNSKKIGASLVWFAPDAESGREPAVTPSTDTADRTDPSADAPRESASTDAQDAEAILRGLDLPGSGGKLDARIDAVLGLYEYLREHAGDAIPRRGLLEHVDADAVGYASRESFWNNFVKANSSQGRDTNALAVLPGVEEWGDGEYRYTEP